MTAPTRPEFKAIIIVLGSGIGLAFALAFAHGDNWGAMLARFAAAIVFVCTIARSLVLLFLRLESIKQPPPAGEGSTDEQDDPQDGGNFPRMVG